jgi:hypothetical protein
MGCIPLKKYPEAEKYYIQATLFVPHRFYTLYFLTKLYMDSDQKQKAKLLARIILAKEIKVPSRELNEIRKEMKLIIIRD